MEAIHTSHGHRGKFLVFTQVSLQNFGPRGGFKTQLGKFKNRASSLLFKGKTELLQSFFKEKTKLIDSTSSLTANMRKGVEEF